MSIMTCAVAVRLQLEGHCLIEIWDEMLLRFLGYRNVASKSVSGAETSSSTVEGRRIAFIYAKTDKCVL